MDKNLIKINGTYNKINQGEEFNIFLVQISVDAKKSQIVENYLGLKKIEYCLEEVSEDYANFTLYDVSLQELNIISKL